MGQAVFKRIQLCVIISGKASQVAESGPWLLLQVASRDLGRNAACCSFYTGSVFHLAVGVLGLQIHATMTAITRTLGLWTRVLMLAQPALFPAPYYGENGEYIYIDR